MCLKPSTSVLVLVAVCSLLGALTLGFVLFGVYLPPKLGVVLALFTSGVSWFLVSALIVTKYHQLKDIDRQHSLTLVV